MASMSEPPARHRLRLELWSWSAWLTLAIISYPAVTMIWLAPRAGLLSGLVVGLLVAYTASRGYTGKHDFERWLGAALLSCGGGLIVGTIALFLDGAPPTTALLCGLILLGECTLSWHFLPWLVRDADAEAGATALVTGIQPARVHLLPRASLGLLVTLALLALGLGAAWSRGEAKVPSPTVWIILVGALMLLLMMIERLASFERASREGNLLLAPGAYRAHISAAVAALVLLGIIAAALPLRAVKAEREAGRLGNVQTETLGSGAGSEGASAAAAAGAAMQSLAEALAGRPRYFLPVLLLLLLLLLALILLWGFRKSRAARWLVSIAARVLAGLLLVWQRLRALFARPARPSVAAAPAQPEDPLLDLFEQPESLSGLTARDIVIRAYHLLLNFAEMLGQGRRTGQTPFEYAHVLRQAAPAASEPVLAMTWGYANAMYGGEQVELPDPPTVQEAWQRAKAALTAGLSEEDLALRKRAYLAARKLEKR